MRFLVPLLGILFFMNSAQSSIIYDNGSVWSTGNNFSIQLVADDFTLTQNSIVTGASLYAFGGLGADTPWDGTIDYAIFMDNYGTPGGIIARGNGLDIRKDPVTGGISSLGNTQYKFSFSFDSPASISANKKYWFGAHIGSNYDDARWYWNFSLSQTGSSSLVSAGGTLDNWIDYFHADRSFSLIGTQTPEVPELPNWQFFGVGLLFGASVKRLKRPTE